MLETALPSLEETCGMVSSARASKQFQTYARKATTEVRMNSLTGEHNCTALLYGNPTAIENLSGWESWHANWDRWGPQYCVRGCFLVLFLGGWVENIVVRRNPLGGEEQVLLGE